jgi:uncharacterized SAM-binding protein YcdF (DUF218 family)
LCWWSHWHGRCGSCTASTRSRPKTRHNPPTPSPSSARLNIQAAPLVITLGGGSDRDSGKTEGGVGRDYLLAEGVPYADIIADPHSFTTGQEARRLAQIARDHNLHHLVVVSDPTHLFRIQALCRQNGLDVYTSPRPALGHIDNYDLFLRYLHEILSYTALELHLNDTWLQRWFDGKGDD